jgi:RalA-binding protein 1
MYDTRQCVSLDGAEPAVVASLLKLFLRELPHPVLTSGLMPRFEEYAAYKEPARRLSGFKTLLQQLPEANRCLIEWIFCHMGNQPLF